MGYALKDADDALRTQGQDAYMPCCETSCGTCLEWRQPPVNNLPEWGWCPVVGEFMDCEDGDDCEGWEER